MNQETNPIYGTLVIDSSQEESSEVQEEVNAMKDMQRQMIEIAAYHLAEKRGFSPGYELDDWLKAEAEILK